MPGLRLVVVALFASLAAHAAPSRPGICICQAPASQRMHHSEGPPGKLDSSGGAGKPRRGGVGGMVVRCSRHLMRLRGGVILNYTPEVAAESRRMKQERSTKKMNKWRERLIHKSTEAQNGGDGLDMDEEDLGRGSRADAALERGSIEKLTQEAMARARTGLGLGIGGIHDVLAGEDQVEEDEEPKRGIEEHKDLGLHLEEQQRGERGERGYTFQARGSLEVASVGGQMAVQGCGEDEADFCDMVNEDLFQVEEEEELGDEEKQARDECIELMHEMLERIEKGPQHPKTGPAERDWADKDGGLTRNQGNWARSHGFEPRLVKVLLDIMSAAEHEMERDLQARLRTPGTDPDPEPESLLRLLDHTDLDDLGGRERIKAQVQAVLSRAQGGSAKQTEAAERAVWEERDRRVAKQEERRERDLWPADECNVEGEVTRSGGAFLIVNGDVLVPGRLYSKANGKPMVGDRVNMDVRRARGSREGGSSMRGCEWSATRIEIIARVSEMTMLEDGKQEGQTLGLVKGGVEKKGGKGLKEVLKEGEAIRNMLSLEEEKIAYEEALADEKRIRRNGWLDDDPDNKEYAKRYPLIGKEARKLWGGGGSRGGRHSGRMAVAAGKPQFLKYERGGETRIGGRGKGGARRADDADGLRWGGKGDLGGREDDSDSFDAIEEAKRDLLGHGYEEEGGDEWLLDEDDKEEDGALVKGEDKPWWMANEDDMPTVKKALNERRRLLAEGNNSYALFDEFGRKMFQERIPSCTPPWLIPSDWYLREFVGCAWGGYTNRMMRFINQGVVSPDAKSPFEPFCGALHLAAAKNNYQCVRRLVAAGADVNIRDTYDETPLRLASSNGCVKCVQVLLCAGADVDARNIHGEGVLETARDSAESWMHAGTLNDNPFVHHCVEILERWIEGGSGCGRPREVAVEMFGAECVVKPAEALEGDVDNESEEISQSDEEAGFRETERTINKIRADIVAAVSPPAPR